VSETPPGYVETRLVDPFEIHVGPVYEQGPPGSKRYALLVDDRHLNMRGVVHGGMFLTYADAALGQAAWDATDHAPSVTLNMQAQFLGSARKGDLIEVVPELTCKTRGLLFIRGDFRVSGKTVFSVQSLWKLLGEG
jgi:acyl-coenzyme A thioesterase PaaI-like protein